MNPLEKAIQSALDTNARIGSFFDKAGTSQKKGFVIRAYESATWDMTAALVSGDVGNVDEVLRTLRAALDGQISSFLHEVSEAGQAEGEYQLSLYRVKPARSINLSEQVNSARLATVSKIETQAAIIRAMFLAGAADEQIVGSADAPGVLRWSDVTSQFAYFVPALFWGGFSGSVGISASFQKQVIAALDERTTDCCLHAHGQIKPLDQPFHLTGEPRFADDLDWAPFHRYCRTSIALYLPQYDDGLTDRMIAGALAILKERAAGGSGERHPAGAYG